LERNGQSKINATWFSTGEGGVTKWPAHEAYCFVSDFDATHIFVLCRRRTLVCADDRNSSTLATQRMRRIRRERAAFGGSQGLAPSDDIVWNGLNANTKVSAY